MARLDFSMNDDYSLIIQNGDFVIQNQELQQAKVILKASKGDVRQFPLVGVSIDSFIGATQDKTLLYNVITEKLREDGLLVDSVEFDQNGNNITFDLKIK